MNAPKYPTYCCDKMREQAEHSCPKCSPDELCADRLIKTPDSKSSRYGLRVRDGGSSYVVIYSCPWCATYLYPDEGQNKETDMEEDRLRGSLEAHRSTLVYDPVQKRLLLKLPERPVMFFDRTDMVTIAMALHRMMQDSLVNKICAAFDATFFNALLSLLDKLVRHEWRAPPAHIRAAANSLHNELALEASPAYGMVGNTSTGLVVFYDNKPDGAVASKFVQSIPPSYQGVPVVVMKM